MEFYIVAQRMEFYMIICFVCLVDLIFKSKHIV